MSSELKTVEERTRQMRGRELVQQECQQDRYSKQASVARPEGQGRLPGNEAGQVAGVICEGI